MQQQMKVVRQHEDITLILTDQKPEELNRLQSIAQTEQSLSNTGVNE